MNLTVLNSHLHSTYLLLVLFIVVMSGPDHIDEHFECTRRHIWDLICELEMECEIQVDESHGIEQ